MLSPTQLQYVEEVLGGSLVHLMASPNVEPVRPATQASAVLVLTSPLNSDESQLLAKILQSVKLPQYAHVTVAEIKWGELPTGHTAPHVLAFCERQRAAEGHEKCGESTWWELPLLRDMIGAPESILEPKKRAWKVLQSIAKVL